MCVCICVFVCPFTVFLNNLLYDGQCPHLLESDYNPIYFYFITEFLDKNSPYLFESLLFLLYARFGPYFCEPVVAGLLDDNTPFLSGMFIVTINEKEGSEGEGEGLELALPHAKFSNVISINNHLLHLFLIPLNTSFSWVSVVFLSFPSILNTTFYSHLLVCLLYLLSQRSACRLPFYYPLNLLSIFRLTIPIFPSAIVIVTVTITVIFIECLQVWICSELLFLQKISSLPEHALQIFMACVRQCTDRIWYVPNPLFKYYPHPHWYCHSIIGQSISPIFYRLYLRILAFLWITFPLHILALSWLTDWQTAFLMQLITSLLLFPYIDISPLYNQKFQFWAVPDIIDILSISVNCPQCCLLYPLCFWLPSHLSSQLPYFLNSIYYLSAASPVVVPLSLFIISSPPLSSSFLTPSFIFHLPPLLFLFFPTIPLFGSPLSSSFRFSFLLSPLSSSFHFSSLLSPFSSSFHISRMLMSFSKSFHSVFSVPWTEMLCPVGVLLFTSCTSLSFLFRYSSVHRHLMKILMSF